MNLKTNCPITGDTNSELIFVYNSPPDGEVKYNEFEKEKYYREVWRFLPSGHYISTHSMNTNLYEGGYVDSTYKNLESMQKIFNKIISLPKDKSDNYGRFNKILNFTKKWFKNDDKIELIDIGSGLGVFPYLVEKHGWSCTALDPDIRSIELINNNMSIQTICGDFFNIKSMKKFNILTLNKVLEHVEDPIKMLQISSNWIKENGFIYIELPDGEVASKYGKSREEFFIEHLHIFSISSTKILAKKAGLKVQLIDRLQEPSSKYTIRAFLSK